MTTGSAQTSLPAGFALRHSAAAPAHEPHDRLVLRLLRRHGPMTRSELGALCGLSRTTLYDVVATLMDDGTVIASIPETERRGRGRPAERLGLNPGAGRLIGVDFAPGAVRVAAMTMVCDDFSTASEPHPPGTPWPDRVGIALRLAGALIGGGPPHRDSVNGVGVCVTGPAGSDLDPSVGALVHQDFGTRAWLDSGTRLAALAETTWGAAQGERDVLYLELSAEVGGGLVTDGVLLRGANGLSGAFNHITVVPGGEACVCGGSGCLQTVASTTAVLKAYGAAAGLPQLVTALNAGDPVAHAVVTRAAAHVGRVLAGLTIALSPGVVVVGGELAAIGPALLEPLENELRAHAVRRGPGPPLRVRPSELGPYAAAIGAVTLLRQPGTGRPGEHVRGFDAPWSRSRSARAGRGSHRM